MWSVRSVLTSTISKRRDTRQNHVREFQRRLPLYVRFLQRLAPAKCSYSIPHTLSLGKGYQYAARQMIKQGCGGRIIGACSVAGKKGMPVASAYCASKFAVRGLTQAVGEWYVSVSIFVCLMADVLCYCSHRPGTTWDHCQCVCPVSSSLSCARVT